jgi:hypothetical protein
MSPEPSEVGQFSQESSLFGHDTKVAQGYRRHCGPIKCSFINPLVWGVNCAQVKNNRLTTRIGGNQNTGKDVRKTHELLIRSTCSENNRGKLEEQARITQSASLRFLISSNQAIRLGTCKNQQ